MSKEEQQQYDFQEHIAVVQSGLEALFTLLVEKGTKARWPTSLIAGQLMPSLSSMRNAMKGIPELLTATKELVQGFMQDHIAKKIASAAEQSDFNLLIETFEVVKKGRLWLWKLLLKQIPFSKETSDPCEYMNELFREIVTAHPQSLLQITDHLQQSMDNYKNPHDEKKTKLAVEILFISNVSSDRLPESCRPLIHHIFTNLERDLEKWNREQKGSAIFVGDSSPARDFSWSSSTPTSSLSSPSRNSAISTNPYPYRNKGTSLGLKNQGATCYLNSVIQSLFATPAFRRMIFKWKYDPATHGKDDQCIAQQMQRIFAYLKFSCRKAVETKDLTHSFGWTSSMAFEQHDTQELLRVLFDHLSTTGIELNKLYHGTLRDYIICKQCKRVSSRQDEFLDLQLAVRDVKHLDEAIENFQFEEILEGENQYMCEQCSTKVDAHKGLHFESLPDILTLHLKRFDIDYATFSRMKLNNRILFPLRLNMNKHMRTMEGTSLERREASNLYSLLAVLIHSGGINGGHYYAHIKDGFEWREFNDSNVTQISESDIERGFGNNDKSSANAYMLLYMRENMSSDIHEVLSHLTDEWALLPEDLRKEITDDNENYRKMHMDFELSREEIELTVRHHGKTEKIKINPEKTVLDLAHTIYEASRENLQQEHELPDQWHISALESETLARQRFLTQENGDNPLKETIFDQDGHLLSFTLVTDEPKTIATSAPQVTFHIQRLLSQNIPNTTLEIGQLFDESFDISISPEATLGNVRQLIEERTTISKQQLCIVAQNHDSYTNHTTEKVVDGEDMVSISKAIGTIVGQTLYVESKNKEDDSMLMRIFPEKRNQINVRFELLDEHLGDVLVMDRRQMIFDLKRKISERIGIDPEGFILQGDDQDQGYVFKDMDEPLNLTDGFKFYVKQGRQISTDDFEIQFFAYNHNHSNNNNKSSNSNGSSETKGEKKHDRREYVRLENARDPIFSHMTHKRHKKRDSYRFVTSMHFNRSTTVTEIKSLLVEKCQDKLEMQDAKVYCLREKLLDRPYPGRLLHDGDLPFETVLSSLSSRQLVIDHVSQTMAAGEMMTNGNDTISLRVAQFLPSSWTLKTSQEITIERDLTIFELKNILISQHFQGDMEMTNEMQMAKVPTRLISQVTKSPIIARLFWGGLDDEHPPKSPPDDARVTQQPWFLKDGDLILFGDMREPNWFEENGDPQALHHILEATVEGSQENSTVHIPDDIDVVVKKTASGEEAFLCESAYNLRKNKARTMRRNAAIHTYEISNASKRKEKGIQFHIRPAQSTNGSVQDEAMDDKASPRKKRKAS